MQPATLPFSHFFSSSINLHLLLFLNCFHRFGLSLTFTCAILLLTGCSGDDDEQLTGQFIDSPVQGLTYETSTVNGTTNALGEFNYIENDKVIFSIGDIALPSVTANRIVTPLTIFNTSDINNIAVINLARLLQSMDTDADPLNGISLNAQALEATAGLDIDFESIQFSSDVISILMAMPSYTSLVPTETALNRLRASIPYRVDDINGTWTNQTISTPASKINNPDLLSLVFEQATTIQTGIITTSRLLPRNSDIPSTPNVNFTLSTTGIYRGEILETGTNYQYGFLGASKDIAFRITGGTESQTLTLGVKPDPNFKLASLAGNWSRFSFQTPAKGNGDNTQFGYNYQTLSFNNNGVATVITNENSPNYQAQSNSYTLTEITVGSLPVLSDANTLYAINANNTVMLSTYINELNNSFERYQYSVLVRKSDSYNQTDLNGEWFGASFSTPVVSSNLTDQLFQYEAINLSIDQTGLIKGTNLLNKTFVDLYNLSLSVNNEGSVSVTNSSNLKDSFIGTMDASKSVIVFMRLNENKSQQTTTVLLKQAIE